MSLVAVPLLAVAVAQAEESWDDEQREVIRAIEALSASTAPGGGGATAYGEILAGDFSRWTMGSSLMNGKVEWLEGVAGWLEAGWRVVEREDSYLEITIVDDTAVVRRIAHESYRGPGGERTDSTAALAEIWLRREGRWLLWRVDVDPFEG